MRKTVNISIGSSLFVIEESAYARLDGYLDGIRAHFDATPDAAEIVSDIEDRIAEEFAEKLSARKKVISVADVDEVIRRMGTVEDFRKFEGGEASATEEPFTRPYKKIRLYRDGEDKVIAGVCAGVAKYFGIDPLLLRLAFGLSLLLGGFGAVLYILLWIILPQARTTAEKVEMTGGNLTLSRIEEKVKKVMPTEKTKGKLQRIFLFPFRLVGMVLRVIGRILGFVLPLLGRIAGTLVMFAMAIGVSAVTFVFLALLLNPQSPYIGFPLRETVGAIPYLLLTASAYLLIVIPLLFVLLSGVSAMLMRSVFSFRSVMGHGGLWLAALVTLAVTGFTVAPEVQTAVEKYHDEHFAMTETALTLSNFTQVALDDHVSAHITRGDRFSVIVEAAKSNTGAVVARVENGVLRIAKTRKDSGPCFIICPSRSVFVTITMPAFSSVEAVAHSSVHLDGFSAAPLRLTAKDHAFIEADVQSDALTVEAASHSSLQLRGSGQALTVNLQDHADMDAGGFVAATADVRMKSHTFASLQVKDAITGSVDDHSHLVYTGSPAVTVTEGSHSDIDRREEEERW